MERNSIKEKKMEDDEDKYRMVPPDGGWGWMIVFSNLILGIIAHSVPMGYGVIYVNLVRYEHKSNIAASMLPALMVCISNVFAPISTALSRFYSYRKIAVVGILFLAGGLALSSITTNIFYLYFTFGVLGGLGHSLVTPIMFLIGQQYFHVRRVMAYAISSLGTTVGFMLLPMIIVHLLQNYSLRGTFLLWSGIVLQGLIFVMFFHPVEWHLRMQKIPSSENLAANEEAATDENNGRELKRIEDIPLRVVGEELTIIPNTTMDDNEETQNLENGKVASNSFESLFDENEIYFDAKGRPMSYMSIKSMDSFRTTRSYFHSMEGFGSILSFRSRPDIWHSALDVNQSENYKVNSANNISAAVYHSVIDIDSKFNARRDINLQRNSALLNNSENNTQTNNRPSSLLVNESITTNKLLDSTSNHKEIIANEKRTKSDKKNYYDLWGVKIPKFNDILKIKLLKNPFFLICCTSSICNRQLYYSFTTYIPTIVNEVVALDKVPYLIFIMAISEFITKLVIAGISDKGWVPRRFYYIGASILNCSSVILISNATNVSLLAVGLVILGMGIGTSVTIGPILLVEHLHLNILPYSYGLTLFIGGIFSLFSYIIQGWSIDKTESTAVLCYIIAFLAIVPGIMWTLASLFLIKRDNNKKVSPPEKL